MGQCCGCACGKMPYTNRILTLSQVLSVVTVLMGAGSFFGLPTAIILLCACCTKVAVCWFIVASLLAALAACEAVTSAYYLLNWREFWDEIVEEIKKDSEKFDQDLADRVYKNFEDYEFVGYICIGVAALWILCAMLICFFAGSYKRFLLEQQQPGAAAAVGVTTTGSHSTAKAGNADGIEQPRYGGGNLYRAQYRPTDTNTRTTVSELSFFEPHESVA